MNRNSIILNQIGYIFLFVGAMLISPIISLFWYPAEYEFTKFFIIPAFCFAFVGFSLTKMFEQKNILTLKRQNQIMFVVVAWAIACVGLTIPFISSGMLNFSQSMLEVSSGLSTTGISVVDVTKSSKMFLLYRSLLQYFGGIGILLIMATIFRKKARFDTYELEGHTDKLVANFRESAFMVVKIYTMLIIFGTFLLMVAGLDSFTALNLSICSLSTGGFAITPHSIADYHSAKVNIILIILMIIGSFSFASLALVIKRDFRKILKLSEVKLFLILIISFSFVSGLFALDQSSHLLFGEASDVSNIMVAFFEITSAISTTGFSLIDYHKLMELNHLFYMLLVIAMLIGGASGSTAGGIKVNRLVVMLKSISGNIKRVNSSPNKITVLKMNTVTGILFLENSDVISAFNYAFIYIGTLFIGIFCFVINGYPFTGALFEMASALGNVGLSIGITSPELSSFLLWVLSIAMFVGRLEIIIVIVIFSKGIDQVKNQILKIRASRKW